MSIHYINGHRLRKAMIAGCMQLIKSKDHLNRINVFPVADGDTGSNMAATMRAILQRSYNSYEPNIGKFTNSIAESALLGARGNSGAILAQFFTGLSEGLKGKFRVNVIEFGVAVEKASSMAMEALSNPREGTILSVMKCWAEFVRKESESEKDFKILLKNSLVEANRALDNTPNQLEVLKKANVVDSGAQGFVNLVEGIVNFLNVGTMKDEPIEELETEEPNSESEPHIEYDPDSILYQFCTEFLLQGTNIDKTQLRKELLALGESMIVAGSNTKVKVHIHSNEPEKVFETASRYGTLVQRKAEDMKAQHHEAWGKDHPPLPVGIVVDSSCDIHPNFIRHYEIKMVPLQVIMGEKEFLDKETITAGEFYGMLEDDDKIHPRTSLPSPARFKIAFMEAMKNKDVVLYFGLSSVVSGTFQAAVTVAKQLEAQFPEKKIYCIDSKSVATASGFALQEVIERIEKGENITSIIDKYFNEIRLNSNIYCYLDTVEYLIRGGRLSKVKGFIASVLGMNPIITFTDEGSVTKAGVAFSKKGAVKFFLSQLNPNKKLKRIGIFHAANLQSSVDFENELRKIYPNIEIPVNELSPVLGAHSGPGAFGFAVQYE